MKIRNISKRQSTHGLTLIELVVVLAILVALAGLIILNLPSLLKKASGSTAANTIQDISRAMNTLQTLKGNFPTAYDSLIETDGTSLAALPAASKAQVAATALGTTAGDLGALTSLGITSVCNLIPYPATAPDATWSVSTNANIITLVAGTKLALVSDSVLKTKLIPNTASYLGTPNIYILGVGKVCTLVGAGSTLLEAPTRTGVSELDNSANFYQRYCVAFVVDGLSATTRKARFLGALVPTKDGFQVTDDQTSLYQSN